MNRSITLFLAFALMTTVSLAQTPWQSKLVKQAADGTLSYTADSDGFVIPDYSQAGYKNGRPIPTINIPDRTVTINPLPDEKADNTKHIQEAIDKVATFTPDADGIRGVVLLKAGRYNVDGTINLSVDGVILRGEGNCNAPEAEQTLLYGRDAIEKKKNLIMMGNSSAHNWGNGAGNDKVNIVNEKVKVGDYSFQVTDASAYSVGDLICVKFPTTEAWLVDVLHGGNTQQDKNPWKVSNIDISYHRYITAIEGNTITIDAPIFYTLDKKYSTSYIYKIPSPGNIRKNIGIENLAVAYEPTPLSSKENVDQNCIYMSSLENSWLKDVSMTGFIHAGLKTQSTTRCTIEGCYAMDPSGLMDGGTWYNFENYSRSQLMLYKNCYARNGRHHYISNGCATVSGIVVLNFTSTQANACSEGHRMFSQGILFDNWKELPDEGAEHVSGFKIGMYLRNNMGTGHGWGGVHCTFWNCDVEKGGIYLDKVPTAQNYAIGCIAGALRRYYNKADGAGTYFDGYIEGRGKSDLQPASLYEAQLKARGIDPGTSGMTTPTVADTPQGEIEVFNLNGMLVMKATDTSRLNVLRPGVYILRQGTKATKFVVR